MKDELSLHEAIVVALINIDKKTFCATFDEIAAYIRKRNLFDEAENCPLVDQVRLRTTQSNKHYRYLFHQVDTQTVQLKSFPLIKQKPAAKKKVIVDGVELSAYMKDKKPIAKLKKNEQILY